MPRPLLTSPVIDLHLDSYIWARLLGYAINERHAKYLAKGFFLGQVDLPRLKDAGITGGLWSITTNPLKTAKGREQTFAKNFKNFTDWVQAHSDQVKLAQGANDFLGKAESPHAIGLSVQGGNAFDHDLSRLDHYAPTLMRVTLMHLTHSSLGTTSLPYPALRKRGLTSLGRACIQRLNQNRIFVDLAHADEATFWDSVKVQNPAQPLLVSHTGVKGVHPHWRNIDDAQIKAIAQTGGVVGILFHAAYLGPEAKKNGLDTVIYHLEHIQKIAGDDFTAIGSDWDGLILPPKGLRDCTELPGLVRAMEKRGWSSVQIEKTLGLNFLRALKQLRPEA